MVSPSLAQSRALPLSRSIILVLGLVLGACAQTPALHRPTAPAPARSATLSQCQSQLRASGVAFTPLPDHDFGAGCSQIDSVKIIALKDDEGPLAITGLGASTCQLAQTIEGWARFGVDRAARQILGSPVTAIETYGSYNCRNVAGSTHRSGHATAHAVDISAIDLSDGRRITITHGWTSANPSERTFLRQIRASACRRFGMVLSPDYNTAHHDHLHLEVGTTHALCR